MTWLGGFRCYVLFVTAANLIWEIAQLPLYTIWTEGTVKQIIFAVVHCTVGGLLIGSLSLLGALLLVGVPTWPADRYWPTAALAIAAGVAYTVNSEWLNTKIWLSWTYGNSMPRLPWIGTGAAPFAQWIVIPLAGFIWLRRTTASVTNLGMMAAMVFALSACSMTLPVQGTMEDGSEAFTGSATGYVDGGGTLQITSNKGLACSGRFVYETLRSGSGTFNCSNGQSGPFQFVSTGARGTGMGRIGGRPFTFTFG